MNRQARILLIEDNPHDVTLTLDAFNQVRLRNAVQVIERGDDALKFFRGEGKYGDRAEFPLPDLVLLDLKLPAVDGHDILREIKQMPVVKRIPVVVLTSSAEEGDRTLSYDIGANSYLVKPVGFDEFLRVARKVGEYWLTLNMNADND